MRNDTRLRGLAAAAGTALAATTAIAAPAHAQDQGYPACPDFNVGITVTSAHGNPPQVGPRAVLAAGTMTVVLTNETTGATTTVRTAGASISNVTLPDGSTVGTATGREVILLFPTDNGGPAATLYNGTTVLKTAADAVGTMTVLSHTGTTTDLCAVLRG